MKKTSRRLALTKNTLKNLSDSTLVTVAAASGTTCQPPPTTVPTSGVACH